MIINNCHLNPRLIYIVCIHSRISNGLSNLSASTKLTHLNLSGNKIKDLEELKPLENFKELEVLDLFNNEATSIDSYRQKIFAMIPSLVYLDGFDVNDVEAVSDGEDDEEVNGNDSDEDGVEGKLYLILTCPFFCTFFIPFVFVGTIFM